MARNRYEGSSSSSTRRGYTGSLQSDLMEHENDDMLSNLSSQVSSLKHLSLDIEAEVLSQNAYLESMDTSFSGAGDLLKQTMTKLNLMLQTGGSKHMWYLAAFVVFFFFLLWLYMKR